jgi:hypothetical protein
MQVHANGQVQQSAAQWSAIITQYRPSGMGSRQFCEAEGLTLRTFEKWYRRQRSLERGKGQFVEVKAPRSNGFCGHKRKPPIEDAIKRFCSQLE